MLGALSVATALRLTRASVAENLRADYVRTARSKGLPGRRVVGVHVLRNSLIPVVTFLGVDLGSADGRRDRHRGRLQHPRRRLQARSRASAPRTARSWSASSASWSIVFLVVNLIVDLLYAVLDPRIRYD